MSYFITLFLLHSPGFPRPEVTGHRVSDKYLLVITKEPTVLIRHSVRLSAWSLSQVAMGGLEPPTFGL